jgi:sulfate permease, SulP family
VVLLFLTGPLQYLPRGVLAAIVFTIAIGMIDIGSLRSIRRESSDEFLLAVVTAAAVVAIGVEQGILLAIALSLMAHVRHSYRPHAMMLVPDEHEKWIPTPAVPGKVTQDGLVIFRFGGDLFYANINHFADEVLALVEHASKPVRWFVVDAAAITDIDYSAAQALRDLIDELTHRGTCVVFARVSQYLRSDLDRHRITGALGEDRVFATLHQAIALATGSSPVTDAGHAEPSN